MPETRQHIKSRMLKNAARLWGYSETQMENSFDPLVGLLFDGCSAELEKLSADIHASRARVMERLVEVLCPETLTGALPAHGLMAVEPLEETSYVDESMQFFTQIRDSGGSESKSRQTLDVYFSPIGRFQLKRLRIGFLIAGNKLFKINGSQKELLGQSKDFFGTSVWLGVSGPAHNLDGLMVYFDTVTSGDKDTFSQFLSKSRWLYNGEVLETRIGLETSVNSIPESTLKFRHSKSSNVITQVLKNVGSYYCQNIVSIRDKEGITNKAQPEHAGKRLLQAFGSKLIESVKGDNVSWIEVKFPEPFAGFDFDNLICRANCFPVINRQIHKINYSVKDFVNIVPLSCGDSFLDLEKILLKEDGMDSQNLIVAGNNELPIVLQRSGSIGRFDERDANGLLANLIDILRQESAAFSRFNNDFIQEEVKKLQQIFNKIEHVLNEKHAARTSTPFLLVNQHELYQGKNIWITYSSTLGPKANQIRPGTVLHAYNSHSFVSQHNELVTLSMGGRDKLNVNQSILAFRSALLSQNKIHSQEDIKAFVLGQLGGIVEVIDVKKGMRISSDPKVGFEKVFEVKIGLRQGIFEGGAGDESIEYWERSLSNQLNGNSLTWHPIDVAIARSSEK